MNNSDQESITMVTELTTLYTKDELFELIINHPTLDLYCVTVYDIVHDWCEVNNVDYDETIKELQEYSTNYFTSHNTVCQQNVSKMSATE